MQTKRRFRVVICRGPQCGDARGSAALAGPASSAIAAVGGPQLEATLDWQSCFGRCSQGPNVLVRQLPATPAAPAIGIGLATQPHVQGQTALYNRVDADRLVRIIHDHVGNGIIVTDYIERPTLTGEHK